MTEWGHVVSTVNRIANIFLDEKSVVRRSPQVEHERKVAIYDLLVENEFILLEGFPGPYNLHLAVEENRLIFDVCDEDDDEVSRLTLPSSIFRRIIKDYFCSILFSILNLYFRRIHRHYNCSIRIKNFGGISYSLRMIT